MKRINLALSVVLLAGLFSLSSCEAIKGLVGFGFWIGVIAVLLIIFVIFWLKSKAGK